ncbi:MAG: trypsin-like peptidase domain-containing protein [bacterium]|nr:trypsin-like peptidase domain-containing protein [bacterium]
MEIGPERTVGVLSTPMSARGRGTGFILKYHPWFKPVRQFGVTAWHVVETNQHGLPEPEGGDVNLRRSWGPAHLTYADIRGGPKKDLACFVIAELPARHYLLWDWGELRGGETVVIPGLEGGLAAEYARKQGTVKDVNVRIHELEGWKNLDVDCFLIDVEIPPGMSGSPVLFRGHVVGVAIASGNGWTLAVSQRELRDACDRWSQ